MPRKTRRPPRSGEQDPLTLIQGELDDRPTDGASPRQRRQTHPAPSFDGFPQCPADRGERTWRLTRRFIEAGEAYGMRRVVSPWYFSAELSATIHHSGSVAAFIDEQGGQMAEHILGRMIDQFWAYYVEESTTRTQAVNLFLDDYWDDLFDQAKSNYVAEQLHQGLADGTITSQPSQVRGSLLNDPDYQAAMVRIREEEAIERVRAEVVAGKDDEPVPARRTQAEIDELLPQLLQRLRRLRAKGNPERTSKAHSGSESNSDRARGSAGDHSRST